MRKKTERTPRESALASGWIVEGDPPEAENQVPAGGAVGDAENSATGSAELSGADVAATEPAVAEASAEAPPQVSNAALVVLGVFGGLYMLYTWGWMVVAQAYASVNAVTAAGSGSLGGFLQQVIFWAAPFAPVLWFIVALVYGRGGRTKRLAILLTVGAVVLLPLPMLIARGG